MCIRSLEDVLVMTFLSVANKICLTLHGLGELVGTKAQTFIYHFLTTH